MELNVKVLSKRGTLIPVTFTCPDGVKKCPLVIGLHGYQSSRHEWGLFDECAASLMQHQIAMVRMDFPGNGDSVEAFTNCTLKNMHDDIDTVLNYIKTTAGLIYEKTGLLGYSMGGLTALTYLERMKSWPDALALWAPGVHMRGFLERNYADAYGGLQNLTEKGSADGVVILRDQRSATTVSYELILDMICENPLQHLRCYQGQFFLAGGEDDSILRPQDFHMADLAAVNASRKTTLFLEGMEHDLGSAWGDKEKEDRNIMNQVLDGTVQFFENALIKTEE